MAAWTGCVAGALTREEFECSLADAGLVDPVARDLTLGLPQIELADLAGSVDRALKRPRWWREQRLDLMQVVIDDRLAALEPERRDQLSDPLARQLGIGLQQPVDLVLERIELRHRPALIDRR
jgi:hypothetical protein